MEGRHSFQKYPIIVVEEAVCDCTSKRQGESYSYTETEGSKLRRMIKEQNARIASRPIPINGRKVRFMDEIGGRLAY